MEKRPGGWVYLVLTFDPSKWASPWESYKGAVRCWDRLRKRLTRRYGRIEYIQTWERHQSGWPHANLVIRNAAIAAAVDKDADAWNHRILRPAAVGCGFGYKTWAEGIRNRDATAGYLVKLSRELVDADGKGQVPVNAPKNFRRLRASRGLLPPVYKNNDYTGRLLQVPADRIIVPGMPPAMEAPAVAPATALQAALAAIGDDARSFFVDVFRDEEVRGPPVFAGSL
jgi:hypothetical protein